MMTLAVSCALIAAVAYAAWRIDRYCEENGYELLGDEPNPIAFVPDPQALVEANRNKTGTSADSKP